MILLISCANVQNVRVKPNVSAETDLCVAKSIEDGVMRDCVKGALAQWFTCTQ